MSVGMLHDNDDGPPVPQADSSRDDDSRMPEDGPSLQLSLQQAGRPPPSDACDGRVRRCRRNVVVTGRGAPTTAPAPASKGDVLINAIQAAHSKLRDSYNKTWAGMYAISVILDPRLRVDYYEENQWEPEMIAHAKRALMRAMEEYGATASQSHHATPGSAAQGESLGGVDGDAFFPHAKRRHLERGSEMEKYLAEPVVDPHVDILAWWKDHAGKYPCLARIARDYLALVSPRPVFRLNVCSRVGPIWSPRGEDR
jgi:hypothetical protein